MGKERKVMEKEEKKKEGSEKRTEKGGWKRVKYKKEN